MNRYKLTKAGIDPNEALKRLGGNTELYERLLTTFPKDEHYRKMVEAIAAGEVNEAFQHAHALKGVTGNMSMNELHEALKPLVEEFRSGSLEHAEELLEPVAESYHKVIEALQ